jgi:hypothetical protein
MLYVNNPTSKAYKVFLTLPDKIAEVHGDTYNYDKVMYMSTNSKVIITCKIHGDFAQTMHSHLNGNGCPTCGALSISKSKRSNKDVFVKKAKALYGDLYEFDDLEYTTAKSFGIITCTKHGNFTKRLDHFLNGSTCPHCTQESNYPTGFSKVLPATLYYLSINNGQAYKIGITNRSVTLRFTPSELKSIKILALWEYPIGEDAYMEEQRILKEFIDYRYTGPDLLQSGNTELFGSDILLLEKD